MPCCKIFQGMALAWQEHGGGLAFKMVIAITCLSQQKSIISVIFCNIEFLLPAGDCAGIPFEQSGNLIHRLAFLTILF